MDLDELADACRMSIISNDMLVTSLHRLNALLSIIYNGDFKDYLDELERYEVLNPALNHLSKLQLHVSTSISMNFLRTVTDSTL